MPANRIYIYIYIYYWVFIYVFYLYLPGRFSPPPRRRSNCSSVQLLCGCATWCGNQSTTCSRKNSRLTHIYGHATAHGVSLYAGNARPMSETLGKKKSINNTDYWFWHRRWRGGRHHRNRTMCTRRHHALYPSASPSATDGAWRSLVTMRTSPLLQPRRSKGCAEKFVLEKPNLFGKPAENIMTIRQSWSRRRLVTHIHIHYNIHKDLTMLLEFFTTPYFQILINQYIVNI